MHDGRAARNRPDGDDDDDDDGQRTASQPAGGFRRPSRLHSALLERPTAPANGKRANRERRDGGGGGGSDPHRGVVRRLAGWLRKMTVDPADFRPE